MKDQFLALINNSAVHRVDVLPDGTKNTRDYGYGIAHYSVGDNFKAEVVFADKTAEYDDVNTKSAFKHALDNRTMVTRFNSTRGAVMQAELSKLANRLH